MMKNSLLLHRMQQSLVRLVVGLLLLFLCIPSAAAQPGQSTQPRLTTQQLYRQFANPPDSCRPYVRWWWNGDKVRPDELGRELQLLKQAGIGGVEINPIEFPWRCDSVGIPSLIWLSQPWLQALDSTFRAAERLQMRCDLLVGSGWPFGSETLPYEDRAQVMLTYAIPLEGGVPITLSKSDLVRAVDPKVTTPNPDRQGELVSLTLTPDTIASLQQAAILTARYVDDAPGDTVVLRLPPGRYILYALVRYRSFASVINGAPGAAGSILDHMNADAVARYLGQLSGTLEAYFGTVKGHLRAYFVDSMELEGCNWTSDFAEQFRRRWGYDILPWLPLISFEVGRLGDVRSYQYGAAKTPAFQLQLDTVRYHFETTKAELLHERYTHTYVDWCHRQGVRARAQAYGRGFFPLESSLLYDIPEGESWTTNYLRHRVGEEMGDADYRRGRAYTMINKYVSSAAHIAGRRLVSAEEMTNTYRVFHTTLELLKLGSDMSAISGTTHSVWHGFNYSPPEAGFPGWVQYGSYLSEQNTWWPYFRQLNDYRARTSALLQQGTLQSRIAILLPVESLWAHYGVQTEPFPNYPKGSLYDIPQLLWEAVHKCGGNCDFVTQRLLDSATIRHGVLSIGAKQYDYLLTLEPAAYSQTKLRPMRRRGHVIAVPDLPDRCYLEWYDSLQSACALPHDVTLSRPDRFLLQNHYRLDDGSDLYFFVNCHLEEPIEVTLTFPKHVAARRTCWRYDATDGRRYRLAMQGDSLPLRIGPADSYLIVFNQETQGDDYRPLSPQGGPETMRLDDWTIQLTHARTGEQHLLHHQQPHNLALDSAFATFAGTLVYRTTVTLDSLPSSRPTILNLGQVDDICEVRVNGDSCGLRWYGEALFDITASLHPGVNQIEITATTLLGNYVRTLTDNKVVQNFVLNRKVPPVPIGILGPITLY